MCLALEAGNKVSQQVSNASVQWFTFVFNLPLWNDEYFISEIARRILSPAFKCALAPKREHEAMVKMLCTLFRV